MPLGMHRVSAKYVPRHYTDDRKLQQFSIRENLLQMSLPVTRRGFTVMTLKPNDNPHTGWVLLRLAPRKHHKFAPEGQTINKDLYLEVLRRLRDAVGRKRPEMWTAGSWLLHHDNAPAHTALSIRWFLAKHPIPTIPQPPYSRNMLWVSAAVFPTLKQNLTHILCNFTDSVLSVTRQKHTRSQNRL
jgi:hypothetical protein